MPALHLPFPLGGRCTGRRGEGPCLPRTAVPVRWAVRGEAGSPTELAACLPLISVKSAKSASLQVRTAWHLRELAAQQQQKVLAALTDAAA